MIMIVFTVALTAGTTQLSEVADFVFANASLRVSLALALVALIIVAIAENTRIPVDNPATHQLLLYISLIACIFAPWGLAQAESMPVAYVMGFVSYVVKLAIGGFLLVVFETSIAKMRVFRVPEFLGAALMLGLLGTLLLFVSRSF
jgi:formate hydrogenlyase subunit 4